MEHYTDELEKQVAECLYAAGIPFEHTGQRLDFYLPDHDIYIEVKRYHSERAAAQLAAFDNVILLQGVKAVQTFCRMLLTGRPGS